MIRPWLMLARRRLMAAFAVSLLLTLVMHMWVSAESGTDVGVFWHHFCGCAPEPDDVRVLMNFPIMAGFIGFLFGLTGVALTASPGGVPGGNMNTRFLLTRPVSRTRVLFAPLGVATLAMMVIPSLTMLLLLGWLWLVRAPSLGHLVAIVQQLPEVAALGAHPRLLQILAAIDFPRRLLGSLALGLCAYAVMASQRWLLLSPRRSFKVFGLMPMFVLFFPMWRFLGQATVNALWMTAPRGAPLGYMPSMLSILLHFAAALAILLGCWRIQRTVEV